MKTLIAEDEPLALEKLKRYLAEVSWIELIHTSQNGIDAYRNIEKLKPELIIIDIQMPGISGIDIISSLSFKPKVIFITAYDEFAIKAFELHALEYILKPYTKKRLFHALHHEKLSDNEVNHPTELQKNIIYKENNTIKSIEISSIQYIKAEGDFSLCITNNHKHLVSYRLKQFSLPKHFLRCHNSYICNMKFFRSLKIQKNSYFIVTENESYVPVSRRKYKEVLSYLKNHTHLSAD